MRRLDTSPSLQPDLQPPGDNPDTAPQRPTDATPARRLSRSLPADPARAFHTSPSLPFGFRTGDALRTTPDRTRSGVAWRLPSDLNYRAQLVRWERAALPEEVEGRREAVRRIETLLDSGATSLRLDRLGLGTLPQLPSTLEVLDVRSNDLRSLPNLPVALKMLDARYNRLAALPELPQSLETLYLRHNELPALPRLPAALEALDVSYNLLITLPPLPASLERLHAGENGLISLPDLPAGLDMLDVRNNQLELLPTLPAALETLDATSNKLTHLPALPRTLTLLYASGNRLSALPALPPELTILEASDNVLTELPALPQTWLSVVVANNRLTDLPSLPSELRWLNVHGNRLPVQFSERNCLAQARRWQQGNLPPAGSNASPPAPADDTGAASAHAAAPETRPNPSPSPSDEVAGAATRRSPVPDSRPSSGRLVRLPPLASRFNPPQLPRRDEYQASAASTARAGAGHVATSRGANVRGALRSEYLPASAVFASWRFSGDNAADFNRFLARLGETSDFVNPSLQPRMIARVDRVIAGMRSAPALRDICFGIATQAIESCSDRITQGIGDMERAKINHDVEVQDHTIAELLAIGRGLFKLKVLDDIADAEIAAQRASGEPMDDLEIRLAYQIGLRDRLELPAVADSMSYRTTANLEPETLTNAEATVRRGLSNSASVNFLADWAPWRRALQHADADGSYERTRVSHQLERDALSIQPAQITEGEWMEELAEMQERQAGDVFRITRRLTRDVLAQEGAV